MRQSCEQDSKLVIFKLVTGYMIVIKCKTVIDYIANGYNYLSDVI